MECTVCWILGTHVDPHWAIKAQVQSAGRSSSCGISTRWQMCMLLSRTTWCIYRKLGAVYKCNHDGGCVREETFKICNFRDMIRVMEDDKLLFCVLGWEWWRRWPVVREQQGMCRLISYGNLCFLVIWAVRMSQCNGQQSHAVSLYRNLLT